MKVNLLEDAVSRAKEQLTSVENELSSMDSKQATKRTSWSSAKMS